MARMTKGIKAEGAVKIEVRLDPYVVREIEAKYNDIYSDASRGSVTQNLIYDLLAREIGKTVRFDPRRVTNKLNGKGGLVERIISDNLERLNPLEIDCLRLRALGGTHQSISEEMDLEKHRVQRFANHIDNYVEDIEESLAEGGTAAFPKNGLPDMLPKGEVHKKGGTPKDGYFGAQVAYAMVHTIVEKQDGEMVGFYPATFIPVSQPRPTIEANSFEGMIVKKAKAISEKETESD